MTAGAFCRWVNEDLLPNVSLAPGYPHQISLETAQKWLRFEVLDYKEHTVIAMSGMTLSIVGSL